MNRDPRKPEIAVVHEYFATKTREAELFYQHFSEIQAAMQAKFEARFSELEAKLEEQGRAIAQLQRQLPQSGDWIPLGWDVEVWMIK